ncbi:MAG: glycosyltransferase family 4 protein [Jatrophihabitans sp.]
MSAPPPRIALVLGTSAGGVGQHVRSLARHLVIAGWPVIVCGPAATQDLFDFRAAGAEFHAVPIGGPGAEPRAAWPLRMATRDSRLLHAHGLRAGLTGVLSGRRPLVVSLHNAVLQTGLVGRAMRAGERAVARRATVTLAASQDLADRSAQLGGRDVRYLPVAAPDVAPTRTRAEVRRELDQPAGRPLVLCVARLHPQKALDILIAASTHWRGSVGAPVVYIVGDGPLRAELTTQIRRLDAPVRLLGHRDDVADLFAAADLVVLPSRWEARPLVLQEAMRAGRAVIATDVGGVAELVGGAARLVPAGDVDALAAAVTAVLADRAELSTLAAASLQRAQSWPDEETTAARIAAVYREVLALD